MYKSLFLLFFIHTLCWSQQNTLSDQIKGKVKSIESKTFLVKNNLIDSQPNYYFIKSFNIAGFPTQIQYMGDDEILDSEEVFTYTNSGKISKIETLKKNGSINKTISVEYDANDNVIREIKVNYKYDVESETTYLYNDSNVLLSKKQQFPTIKFSTTDLYFYNDLLQIREIQKATPDGNSKEVYSYNEKGYLLEKAEYDISNKIFSSIMYEYNLLGDKISLFKFDPSGEMTYFEQYEYVYDNKGNWTEKKTYVKGDFMSIEKRVIKYY